MVYTVLAMNENILLSRSEAALHADSNGYVWYATQWGDMGFWLDTPHGSNGWWANEFFRTEDGRVKTVLGTGDDTARLKFRNPASPLVPRNEHISEAPADRAFLLALNGTITPEIE